MTEGIKQTRVNSTNPPELVLNSLFKNQKGLSNLIIIQDCPSQSGLPILFQLIQQSTIVNSSDTQQRENVLFIKTTSDLLLDHFQKNQSQLKSDNNGDPFQSIDLAQLVQDDYQKEKSSAVNHKFDSNDLLQHVHQALSRFDTIPNSNNQSRKPLSILVDTVQELFRLFSTHQTFHFVKNLLNLLPTPESRLIILDSPHLNLKANNDGLKETIEPSLGLRSLALSTSHLHLRIHPTSLIDHLVNDFGLTLPVQSTKQSGTHYDLRLFQLIDELAPSCDPYLIGNSTTEKGGLITIPQALLIPLKSSSSSENKHLGSCAIHWTAKNLQSSFGSRPSTSIKSAFKKSTKSQKNKSSANLSSVQHGLEALQLSLDPLSSAGYQLTPVPLLNLIRKRSFKLAMPVGDKTRSDSAIGPLQSQLTFNLSLTDKQRADREAVELPFLPKRSQDGTVIEAPGEMYDGSFQKADSKYNANRAGGMVLYEPDSADDFDSEEPDED